jgi:EAL domain-containing protein (putative c-di-GMP-specific phosphodiesterase class I)
MRNLLDEGVETSGQVEILLEAGVRMAQGRYFSAHCEPMTS